MVIRRWMESQAWFRFLDRHHYIEVMLEQNCAGGLGPYKWLWLVEALLE